MNPWMRTLTGLPGGGAPVRRRRPNALVGIYRWRYELVLLGVSVALGLLGRAVDPVIPLAVVAGLAALLTISHRARRIATDRIRSVVVQHRLRSAFHELCLVTWAGRVPAILFTAQRCDVLRVHLLCPAGIAPSHFSAEVLEALAAACDVPRIEIEPNLRHTALVVLVVVLRDPPAESPARRRT
jgi:hypothetical protein